MMQEQGNFTGHSLFTRGGYVMLIMVMVGLFSMMIVSGVKAQGAIAVGDTDARDLWHIMGLLSFVFLQIFGFIARLGSVNRSLKPIKR